MGIIKDRNCKDPTEAEEIKNRGKNTQENNKKEVSMTRIITMMRSLT